MKDFIIFVDNDTNLPCEIDFDGEISNPDELDAKGRESQKGLWILTLHTSMQRKSGAKAFNSHIETPLEHDDLISALFTPLSRANISPSHWLVEVFNDNPRSRYLTARTREGRKVVQFTDTVSVSIVWLDSRIPCNFEELTKFKQLWLQNHSSPPELYPQVSVLSSIGNYVIDKASTNTYLTHSSQIQLVVKSNYLTNFCIFWLDSEANLSCLYPIPDPKLEIPASRPSNTKNGQLLIIPEKKYLCINTRSGVETCIILNSCTHFSSELVEEIRNKILISKFNDRPMSSGPSYKSQVVRSSLTPIAKSIGRLGGPLSMNKWEQEVAANLSTLTERIHFFHIPNKS